MFMKQEKIRKKRSPNKQCSQEVKAIIYQSIHSIQLTFQHLRVAITKKIIPYKTTNIEYLIQLYKKQPKLVKNIIQIVFNHETPPYSSFATEGCLIKVFSLEFPNLKNLFIDGMRLSAKGLLAITRVERNNLKEIYLRNILSAGDNFEIIFRANWPNLILLKINKSDITSNTLKGIKSANFQNLLTLSLYNNSIGNRGLMYLAKANFHKLQELDVSFNKISDEGLKYLVRAGWVLLKRLQIGWNLLGAEGLQILGSNASKDLSINFYLFSPIRCTTRDFKYVVPFERTVMQIRNLKQQSGFIYDNKNYEMMKLGVSKMI